MRTYVALFKFIDGVDAVVEDALSCVPLVTDEADKDVGIRAAATHSARAHRHTVFDHWGDTSHRNNPRNTVNRCF